MLIHLELVKILFFLCGYCVKTDLKLPLALRCGLSPPSWLLTLLMPVSLPSILAWNKCFIWLETCRSPGGFLLLIGYKIGIPNLWHRLADTELLHNLCIWGGVVFQSLKLWAQFLQVWALLPVLGAWGASCQCSVNPYMCSKSNWLLFVHAAYHTSWKIKAALSLGWGILKGFCK